MSLSERDDLPERVWIDNRNDDLWMDYAAAALGISEANLIEYVRADLHRGAVEDRVALSVMLKRLLDVALVDGRLVAHRLAVADVGGRSADDLEQRRIDAAVGRALRETEAILPDAPRLHVSWSTDRGGSSGRMLVDHPLYSERVAYAEAARALYDAAAEYAEREGQQP